MKTRVVQKQAIAFRDALLKQMERRKFSGAILVGKPVDVGGTLLVGAPKCSGAQVDDVAFSLIAMTTDLLLMVYPPDVVGDVVHAFASRRLMQHRRSAEESNMALGLGALLSGGEILPGGGITMPVKDVDGD